jgi:hypothetical protein
LQAPGSLDIPRVDEIPVVSRLAKKSREEKLKEMDAEEAKDFKKKERKEMVSKIIEEEDDQLETHFVDNPYISKRVRATSEATAGQVKLGQAHL